MAGQGSESRIVRPFPDGTQAAAVGPIPIPAWEYKLLAVDHTPEAGGELDHLLEQFGAEGYQLAGIVQAIDSRPAFVILGRISGTMIL